MALAHSVARVIIFGVPAALTDCPAARWIRAWSPGFARLAWAALLSGIFGLCGGGFATARGEPRLSSALTLAGLVAAYTTVFVQQVGADTHRDRERASLGFSARRRRPPTA